MNSLYSHVNKEILTRPLHAKVNKTQRLDTCNMNTCKTSRAAQLGCADSVGVVNAAHMLLITEHGQTSLDKQWNNIKTVSPDL